MTNYHVTSYPAPQNVISQQSRYVIKFDAMNELGENIKKARLKAGLNQTQLGQACGWGGDSQTRVSNYERGRREPTLGDLRTIAAAVGSTLFDLIGEDTESSRATRVIAKIKSMKDDELDFLDEMIDRVSSRKG